MITYENGIPYNMKSTSGLSGSSNRDMVVLDVEHRRFSPAVPATLTKVCDELFTGTGIKGLKRAPAVSYEKTIVSECRPNEKLRAAIQKRNAARRALRRMFHSDTQEWLQRRKAHKQYLIQLLRSKSSDDRKLSYFILNYSDDVPAETPRPAIQLGWESPAAKARREARGWVRVDPSWIPTLGESHSFRSEHTVAGRFFNWLLRNPGLNRRLFNERVRSLNRGGRATNLYALEEVYVTKDTRQKRGKAKARYKRAHLDLLMSQWMRDNPKPVLTDGIYQMLKRAVDDAKTECGNAIMFHTCDEALVTAAYCPEGAEAHRPGDLVTAVPYRAQLLDHVSSFVLGFEWSGYRRHDSGWDVIHHHHPSLRSDGPGHYSLDFLKRMQSMRTVKALGYDGIVQADLSSDDGGSWRYSPQKEGDYLTRNLQSLRTTYTQCASAELKTNYFVLSRSLGELKDMPRTLRELRHAGPSIIRSLKGYGRAFSKAFKDPSSPWFRNLGDAAELTAREYIALDLTNKFAIAPTYADVKTVEAEGIDWCTQLYARLRQLYSEIREAVEKLTLKEWAPLYPQWRRSAEEQAFTTEGAINICPDESIFKDGMKTVDVFDIDWDMPTMGYTMEDLEAGNITGTIRTGSPTPLRITQRLRDLNLYGSFDAWRDPTFDRLFNSAVTGAVRSLNPDALMRYLVTLNCDARCFCRVDAAEVRKVLDGTERVLEGIASSKLLTTGWELVPLSFIVDWFAGIDTILRDWQRVLTSVLTGVGPTKDGVWYSTHASSFLASPIQSLDVLLTNFRFSCSSWPVQWRREDPTAIWREQHTYCILPQRLQCDVVLTHREMEEEAAEVCLQRFTRRPVSLVGDGSWLPRLDIRMDLGKLTSLLELAIGLLR